MKGFTIRFLIYGLIAAYIFIDVKVIKGPIHGWILEQRGKSVEELRAEGVAATVFGQPIFESQVDYRIQEYLYQRGERLENLSEIAQKVTYKKCLEELILEHLIRIKVHHNASRIKGISDQVTEEIEYDLAQFGDEIELQEALKQQGYEKGELELRAEGHYQQLAYLDLQIDVSAVEELDIPNAQIPELRRIRHIFYSTWNQDPGQKVREVQDSLGPLRTGWATFESISDRINNDPNAKKNGGEVGWVSPHRLPEGLAAAVFAMEIGEQKLVQSKIGWHYIEVLEVRPAQTKQYREEDRDLIAENNQRQAGLDLYLRHLRHREDDNVKIITERFH